MYQKSVGKFLVVYATVTKYRSSPIANYWFMYVLCTRSCFSLTVNDVFTLNLLDIQFGCVLFDNLKALDTWVFFISC